MSETTALILIVGVGGLVYLMTRAQGSRPKTGAEEAADILHGAADLAGAAGNIIQKGKDMGWWGSSSKTTTGEDTVT